MKLWHSICLSASQGHFNYSSQKAGASTVSHLRFGPKPIRSEYEIESSPGADYVACHHTSFLGKFDMLSKAGDMEKCTKNA